MLYVSELILGETLNRMIQHRIDDLPSHFILCLLKSIKEHYHVALLLLVHNWLYIGLQRQKRLEDYFDLFQGYQGHLSQLSRFESVKACDMTRQVLP